jgi:hypothetical protein
MFFGYGYYLLPKGGSKIYDGSERAKLALMAEVGNQSAGITSFAISAAFLIAAEFIR